MCFNFYELLQNSSCNISPNRIGVSIPSQMVREG
ncbi:hypothetical protein CIPAW_09G105100 [Carya illinoinensis]|uniref:Uncharacterized protein n=1 Tax=Carya illinoinensis TaxID=32201 RepID=A0A8T1PNE2_CARIL|nr:hypothetical protein CIPAW_09G105100 [Carya illinoinensis]